jgi:UPF0755 protein
MKKENKLDTIQIDPNHDSGEKKVRAKRQYWAVWLSTSAIIILTIFVLVTSPQALPPKGVQVNIEKGSSLSVVTDQLYKAKIVRSKAVFNFLMRISGSSTEIKPGIYLFSYPKNMVRIIWQVRHGDYGVEMAKVTFPEGATNAEYALIIKKALPNFDTKSFLEKTKDLEGQMFPETYYISPLATVDQVIEQIHSVYENKIQPLQTVIAESGRTEKEILTMASLLEEEAKDYEAKKVISGILWKRISSGMKLQVDAVFPYIMNKNTFTLTKKDLTVNSPYNTYRYAGLPPAPISNPGINSILAALYPDESTYLFYLSDKQGKMHYADTYEEH